MSAQLQRVTAAVPSKATAYAAMTNGHGFM